MPNNLPSGEVRIQAHGAERDVVFCVTDPSASSILSVLKAAGIADDVLVYGVDGCPDTKAMDTEWQVHCNCSSVPQAEKHHRRRKELQNAGWRDAQQEIQISVKLVNTLILFLSTTFMIRNYLNY